jgi:deoxyribodipyrimidine photo-lyase
MPSTVILWLRRDLRLDDNPALQAALVDCDRLVPVYVHDPDSEAPWAPGAASRWWLHGSLLSLDQALKAFGSRLLIARGDSLAELRRIVAATGATRIHWNRLYDPTSRERDGRIKQALRADGLRVDSHNASFLFEPWEIATGTGEPYRVFTAFWRRCAARLSDVVPLPAPAALPPPPESLDSLPLERLGLLPAIPWDAGLRETWTPGRDRRAGAGAGVRAGPNPRYATERDLPAQTGTSELSPHLHFGEIGPRRILAMVKEQWGDPTADPVEPFVREIGWREFATI